MIGNVEWVLKEGRVSVYYFRVKVRRIIYVYRQNYENINVAVIAIYSMPVFCSYSEHFVHHIA